jgi:hypothetical protein
MILKIRRVLIVVLMAISPAIAFSQKLNKPTIDKFTNDTISSTTQEKIASSEKSTSTVAEILFASLSRVNDRYYLYAYINATKEDHDLFTMMTENNMILKLSDNTLIRLPVAKNTFSKIETIKRGFVERTYIVANVPYIISKENLEKLLSGSVTNIRVETGGTNIDFEINPKDRDVFKKMFALITGAK